MVSVGGNLYSVPDCTRRRAVEVHVLAEEIRIFEDDRLIASHLVLDGGGQRRIADGHRTAPPPPNSQTPREAPPLVIGVAGSQVPRRPLDVYAEIGRRLATEARP